MDPLQRVKNQFDESMQVISDATELLAPLIARAAHEMATALLNERMIWSCGNGGSAALSEYFASIMLDRLKLERPGLPAGALTANSSVLTALAADYQCADIFSRQIRVLGRPGDILLAMSVSGNPHNLVQAIDAAHDRNMQVIALTGQDGGSAESVLEDDDIEIRVPSWDSVRIQELHQLIIHTLCDLVERQLLGQED